MALIISRPHVSVAVMSRYSGERVLVVPRQLFEKIGAFHGFRFSEVEDAMQILLAPHNHFFMDRETAENDPDYKQLIPYCIIRHGNRILNYTRGKSGGESRLHALLSIGVGGHINPIDAVDSLTGPEAYRGALARELLEELNFSPPGIGQVIGLINDDSTEVGRVHLGIVHLIEVKREDFQACEKGLTGLTFSPLSELAGPLFENLETWSKFCVNHLAGMVR